MAMQNFYDPERPPGFTEALEKHRFVSMHIYAFPNLESDDALRERIQNHVEKASAIWCNKCKIEVFASTLQQLSENIPGDLAFDTENIDPGNAFPPTVLANLMADNLVYRTGCSDTEIAVYYVKGKRFKNGTTSGHARWKQTFSGTRHFIIMTEAATAEVLAHEIGHHLFVRPNPANPNQYFDDNPDTGYMDPNVKSHDTRTSYLMNSPTNEEETDISHVQCAIINRECKLLEEKQVLIGYDPPPGVLQRASVVFENMHVFHVSDEIGGPHLESSWNFYAYERDGSTGLRTANFTGNSWIESDLFGPKDYDLTFMGRAIVDITQASNTLEIQVDGSDDDTKSNDALPVVKMSYNQAANWGIGTHIERGENDEIMYDVTYTIQSDLLGPVRFGRRCQAQT